MGISITRVVKFIRKGKGVIIAQSSNVFSYTESAWKNYYSTNGRLISWAGITNAADFTREDTMVIVGVVSDKDNIPISLYTEVDDVDTIHNVVTASSRYYIMNGKNGQPGEDAINIEISPSPILHKKSATSTTYQVSVKVYEGTKQLPYGYNGQGSNFVCTPPSTLPSSVTIGMVSGGSEVKLNIAITANAMPDCEIPITITTKKTTYTRTVMLSTVKDGDKGDKGDPGQNGGKGERGAILRGPQAWSDCGVGYVFQSGANGEEFKDVVMYGNNYYSCVKSHTKTSANYPTSTTDTNNGYWKLADKFEMVATKILLAQYALVKNLGVEAVDMKDSAGNIIFQAKDGNVICNSGTFNSIKVTGDSEFSGTMKGISGSFKSLNCVNSNGNIVGSITFGSDGKMQFDGDMYSQGYNYEQKRGNRFYTSDLWCRGMFGHYQKTMAVVKGSYMMVYTKDTNQSGVYVDLKTGMTSNNKTFYYIPLYSPGGGDASGMPIDVVVFNTASDYYYAFTNMGNGKEWRVINGNDKQTVHFVDIGGWHELTGGASVNCIYISPSFLNPVPATNDIGRGVFWTGETDLNW